MTQSRKGQAKGRKVTSSPEASSYRTTYIIDDQTPNDEIYCPVIDGQVMAHGLVKRDYAIYPREMFRAPPADMPLIPESEVEARVDEQEAQQSSLEHLFKRMAQEKGVSVPFLHQNGHGYCWAYSTGNATMLDRCARNMPYVRLNPHAVAAIIKRGADEGGWCGLSAKFLREVGIPTEEFWQVHSRNTSQDTAAMRANAAKFKTLEDWADLSASIYDLSLSKAQLWTGLLSNVPGALDYGEWGHSISVGRWVRIERGYYGPRIMNSWLGWGDNGWGTIARSWTWDSALLIRATGAAVK